MRYHCDLMMHGPGLVLAVGRFRIDGTNDPDRTVDGVPNVKQTVVDFPSTGHYTVQLPKVGGGYPQELISCVAQVAYIDDTDAGLDEINTIRYTVDSYDKATGTFTLTHTVAVITDAAGSVTVGNPNDNSEVHFQAVFRNVGILAQTF